MADNTRNILKRWLSAKDAAGIKPLFRLWLLSGHRTEEKDEAMEEIWHDTQNEGHDTKKALDKVSMELFGEKASRRPKFTAIAVTAAAVAVIAVSLAAIIVNSGKPQEIILTECRTGYGETEQIILPDRSVINLNSGSILIFPEEFSGNERNVYLSGEASFNVASNKGKPFSVHTPDFDIIVTGTEFNISTYIEDKISSVFLKEGSVLVRQNDSERKILLEVNDCATYDRETGQFSVTKESPENIMDWTKGDLLLRGATMEEVAKKAERYFNIEISYSDSPKFREARITARFSDRESPENFLEVLQKLIPGSEYSISGRHVYLN